MNEEERDALVDAVYEKYWAPILEDDDGDIDFRLLKVELYNCLLVGLEYAQVYNFVTDGVLADSVRNYLVNGLEDFLDGQ